LWAALAVALVLTGCADKVRHPSAVELGDFGAAIPAGPSVDLDQITRAMIPRGPYRVVPGDTLQVEMLSVLDPESLRDIAAAGTQEFKCRVDDRGALMLPIVGRLPVAGMSLSEIESSILAAYYPKYVRMPFPVHVGVLEYDARRVSIVGAVAKPGVYALRHDEMSLVSLLMQAGGISEKGAAVIRITHERAPVGWREGAPSSGATAGLAGGMYRAPTAQHLAAERTGASSARGEATSLILPVKGLNIPFADVALEEGDRVVVEWPEERFVSVVGLVNRPGNFPYPATAHYTLIQAIGLAGGLDLVADPRYVSVYRLRSDGAIASITVQLVDLKADKDLTNSLALTLSPGDVVSVEHTPRTRANVFFERIFRVNLGLYFNPDDIWRND
jgi:polysaccharide export outer membrane protein